MLQYLKGPLQADDEQFSAWYAHWIHEGFRSAEQFAKAYSSAGDFVFGDSATLADACLIPQTYNARRFKVPLVRNLMEAKEKGADIHLFDSVAGATGSVATWHPTFPGSEGQLALGIARMIFKWGKIDYAAMAKVLCPAADGRIDLMEEFKRLQYRSLGRDYGWDWWSQFQHRI